MERVMSVEDKIRRAEEIYYRRKEQDIPLKENIIPNSKKKENKKYVKKMTRQIIICILIYGIFYIFTNNNYILSESFIKEVKEILEKDINFSQISSFFTNFIKTNEKKDEDKIEETYQDIQNNNENIGGAEENTTSEPEQIVETNIENTEITQMSQM